MLHDLAIVFHMVCLYANQKTRLRNSL